ncbi:nitrogenase component 1 [Candidatus Chlorohelix sp.]|uniref:nitrogenase component 1 n=1 Tax=Candidatus Chlorohelix sp. TaxID=3139201 RepID=UPI00305F2F04
MANISLVKKEDLTEQPSDQRCLEAPKYTCSLGGALAVITNINRIIPIIHAGAGCGQNQLLSFRMAGGLQGIGYISGVNAPSTNMSENEVVFGGETRLRDQVRATLDLIDGDAYFVVAGCISNMIGDDIDSVAREFAEEPTPVLAVNASGFSGNSNTGYELVFETFIRKLVKPKPKVKGLVNILGIVPYQDVFWRGNLRAIKEALQKLGLKVNQFVGDASGLEGIKNISAAELSIVISPWVGVKTAKLIEEKFDVPYVTFPFLPSGPIDTSAFVRAVAQKLKIPKAKYEKLIAEEEAEAYNDLNIAGDSCAQFGPALPFNIIAGASTAVGITRYLTKLAGFTATQVIINDDPPEEVREEIIKNLQDVGGLPPKVVFEIDSWEIRQHLKKSNFRLLLATSQERFLAESEGKIFLNVSFPANSRLVVRETYAGYGGGVAIIEHVLSKFIVP